MRLGGVLAGAATQMLVDDAAGRFFAATAAACDRQAALNLIERRGTVIDGFADRSVSHGVADTDVHEEASEPCITRLLHPISI
jgi:hypothetical protein